MFSVVVHVGGALRVWFVWFWCLVYCGAFGFGFSEFVVLCDWCGADSSCFWVVTFWFLGLAWVWLSGFGGSAVCVGFGLVVVVGFGLVVGGCCGWVFWVLLGVTGFLISEF